MKKIISILLLALTLTLLSGCIIIDDRHFSITCNNNTEETITDWCVKKDNNKTYANDEDTCRIKPHKEDTISNLPIGYYSICITFEEKYQLHPSDYEISKEIYLDEDVTFNVAKRHFYSRSAIADNKNDDEQQYILIINGKEYPLVKTN